MSKEILGEEERQTLEGKKNCFLLLFIAATKTNMSANITSLINHEVTNLHSVNVLSLFY